MTESRWVLRNHFIKGTSFGRSETFTRWSKWRTSHYKRIALPLFQQYNYTRSLWERHARSQFYWVANFVKNDTVKVGFSSICRKIFGQWYILVMLTKGSYGKKKLAIYLILFDILKVYFSMFSPLQVRPQRWTVTWTGRTLICDSFGPWNSDGWCCVNARLQERRTPLVERGPYWFVVGTFFTEKRERLYGTSACITCLIKTCKYLTEQTEMLFNPLSVGVCDRRNPTSILPSMK